MKLLLVALSIIGILYILLSVGCFYFAFSERDDTFFTVIFSFLGVGTLLIGGFYLVICASLV